MNHKCTRGDWVAVPLANGGYAVGMMAAIVDDCVALVYFFGPRFDRLPTEADCRDNTAESAILVRRISFIVNRLWTVIAHDSDFSIEKWPMPHFAREHPGKSNCGMCSIYDRETFQFIKQYEIPHEEIGRFPEDCTSGFIAMQYQLTEMLPVAEPINRTAGNVKRTR